jgi:hypothetical protein
MFRSSLAGTGISFLHRFPALRTGLLSQARENHKRLLVSAICHALGGHFHLA